MNIAEDNLEKLNKHKKYPPHPSYIAGINKFLYIINRIE